MDCGKQPLFFSQDIPSDFVVLSVDQSIFTCFDEANHRLMFNLVDLSMESLFKESILKNEQNN